jgi:hypothetical protein
MGGLQATLAVGEEEFGVAMELPETAQGGEGGVRQRHEAIPVAFA